MTPAVRAAQAHLMAGLGHRAAASAPEEARRLFGDLACIEIVVGDATEFPEPRDFAYCEYEEGELPRIVVAPRFGSQSPERITGVLAHEYGHASMFLLGHPDHAERDADQAVAVLFGFPIRYDADDVQTIDPGATHRQRPAYLG